METFLVGGAVRDKLLGLPVKERDWVVVGATPREMLDLGFKPVGKDFPVFLHPVTKEEYALARTERKIGPGYKGFEFHADPDVTLEQDLLRRDLTINAMAETENGEIIDPYGGQGDLTAGRLRHVSPAFAEDPVRILRVARFAARFAKWGFSVAHGTNALMRRMVADGEVDYLVPERVWAELSKALTCDAPERFFAALHGCHALDVLFPEIEREYRAASGHAKALPAALVALQQAASESPDPQIRFALLMLALGADLALDTRLQQLQALCERYRLPKAYANLADLAVRLSVPVVQRDAEQLLMVLETSSAYRHVDRWRQLLTVYRLAGVFNAAYSHWLETLRDQTAAVSAASLNDPALKGAAIGEAIRSRRLQIIQQLIDTAPAGD